MLNIFNGSSRSLAVFERVTLRSFSLTCLKKLANANLRTVKKTLLAQYRHTVAVKASVSNLTSVQMFSSLAAVDRLRHKVSAPGNVTICFK